MMYIVKEYHNFQIVNDKWEHYLSCFVGTSFEVLGSSALLVTVVDFVILGGDFTFYNCMAHLANSMAFLVLELPLNNIKIVPHDVVFNVTWLIIYLVFIFTIVAARVR